MNPALPKTRIATQKGRAKEVLEMHKQFSKGKITVGITKKGRAG